MMSLLKYFNASQTSENESLCGSNSPEANAISYRTLNRRNVVWQQSVGAGLSEEAEEAIPGLLFLKSSLAPRCSPTRCD